MASVSNYYVGKGIVYFQGPGDTSKVDLGNCPKFEFTPKVEKLDHWSSRLGTRFKDLSIVVAKEAEVALTLDEWTPYNLVLALLGSTDGSTVNILDLANLQGSLTFIGANDQGPKKVLTLPNVILFPNQKLDMISNEWGEIELQGQVMGDPTTGSFGTIVNV